MNAIRRTLVWVFWFMASLQGLAQAYIDVAPSLGVNVLFNSQDNWGSGVSFYDFDQDGWDDLTFCKESDSILFFKNVGGTFIQQPSYIYGWGRVKTVIWVDFDNDGDMDLFSTSYEGKHKLYANNGSFLFTDISIQAGLNITNTNGYGVSFADYDGDGFLDIYVCNYETFGDATTPHKLNQLYKNNGNGTFTNVTLQAGVGDGFQPSFQGCWFDYDEDGLIDLYVINDRGLWNNSLYKNNGNGTFTNVAAQAGALVAGMDPMTNSVGDYDNDGDFDIFMTNTGGPTHPVKLLTNNGNGTFTENAAALGVIMPHWSWGGLWVDYDNNGYQDLYAVTAQPGTVIPQVNNFFFVNNSGTGFSQSNQIFSSNPNIKSYSLAKGDFNNDGFYDILQLNNQPAYSSLWQNQGGGGNFIKFTLQGVVSNRMAVGSLIRIYAGGNMYTRFTHCGENYVSQDSQHMIVGIGSAQTVDSLVIRYPSGYYERFYNLPANHQFHFIEGETYTASLSANGSLYLCENGSVTLSAGSHHTYLWNTGSTDSSITVTEPGLYFVTVQNAWGLSAQSDTLSVTQLTPQDFIVEVENPSCFGASDGSLYLNSANFPPGYSIVWSTGFSGNHLQNLGDGLYTFVYSDSWGCESVGSYILTEPPPLLSNVNVINETEAGNGSVSFDVLGGTPPYNFLLNGIPVNNPATNLSAGTYQLIITDQNGCLWEITFIIQGINNTQLEESVSETWNWYPNPIKQGEIGILHMPVSGEKLQVSVYNLLGIELAGFEFENNISGELSIPIPSLAKGTYIITVRNRFMEKNFRVVVAE